MTALTGIWCGRFAQQEDGLERSPPGCSGLVRNALRRLVTDPPLQDLGSRPVSMGRGGDSERTDSLLAATPSFADSRKGGRRGLETGDRSGNGRFAWNPDPCRHGGDRSPVGPAPRIRLASGGRRDARRSAAPPTGVPRLDDRLHPPGGRRRPSLRRDPGGRAREEVVVSGTVSEVREVARTEKWCVLVWQMAKSPALRLVRTKKRCVPLRARDPLLRTQPCGHRPLQAAAAARLRSRTGSDQKAP